jgi:hypothetical protein
MRYSYFIAYLILWLLQWNVIFSSRQILKVLSQGRIVYETEIVFPSCMNTQDLENSNGKGQLTIHTPVRNGDAPLQFHHLY